MRNSNLRWAIALAFILILGPEALQSQGSWSVIPAYDGLQVRNGMLVFANQSAFDRVYQDLEQRISSWNADPNAPRAGESPEQPCPDDNAVLALFEQRYPAGSIRKASLQAECDWLNAGRNPADFTGHHLVDELLASLFNAKYQLQVGTNIYYIPVEGITYIVANEDMASLRALERGENPYGLPNVAVYGPEDGCSAEFSVNTTANTTSVGFAFIGEPQTGVADYFWEFGDGTISALQNPVHNYATAGTYTVCLTVEADSPKPCSDRVCKDIQVGSSGCTPFFIYNETGQPGGICFLDYSNLLENVTSWHWEFGDGSEGSDQPNPCHVFPCDKTYFVTLTIKTGSGCTGFFGLPVKVDSYACCSEKAQKKDVYYYASNQKQIRYNQRHIQIPFLYHRVVATVKNFKLNSNGNWAKAEADLRIDLGGSVYLIAETGCKCHLPFSIAKMEIALDKKTLTITKPVGKFFKAKKASEWNVKYTVNNTVITQQSTPVFCE